MPYLNLNLMKKKSLIVHVFVIIGVIILFGSCTPAKNIIYFENVQKDTSIKAVVNNNFELRIRKNDILDVNIISTDPVYTALFNGTPNSTATIPGAKNIAGFLVDNQGNISIYKLGAIHVEGLTRTELKQKLQRDLVPYLKDAVVSVRFLNNRVTVLGEVLKPGVISIQNEQIPLLEAIGQAGDLTITGRRDNVLVIRDTEKGKQFKRINLTDNSLFSSPFYNLNPNDIVYVEPNKMKLKNLGQNRDIIGYILSGSTILITIIFYIFR